MPDSSFYEDVQRELSRDFADFFQWLVKEHEAAEHAPASKRRTQPEQKEWQWRAGRLGCLLQYLQHGTHSSSATDDDKATCQEIVTRYRAKGQWANEGIK